MSVELVATATLPPTSHKWDTTLAMMENITVMPLPETVCTALNTILGKVTSTPWLSLYTLVMVVADGGTLAMVVAVNPTPSMKMAA